MSRMSGIPSIQRQLRVGRKKSSSCRYSGSGGEVRLRGRLGRLQLGDPSHAWTLQYVGARRTLSSPKDQSLQIPGKALTHLNTIVLNPRDSLSNASDLGALCKIVPFAIIVLTSAVCFYTFLIVSIISLVVPSSRHTEAPALYKAHTTLQCRIFLIDT